MKKFCISILMILLCAGLFAKKNTVQAGSNRVAQYVDENIGIFTFLVSDINAEVEKWFSIPESDAPGFSPINEITLENNGVAPFVIYQIIGQEEYPVYYDCELVKPNGSKSKYKGKKMILVEEKPERLNLMYIPSANYGWLLEESDPEGDYKVLVNVYTEKKKIVEIELPFKYVK